jgi:hypothetical protein
MIPSARLVSEWIDKVAAAQIPHVDCFPIMDEGMPCKMTAAEKVPRRSVNKSRKWNFPLLILLHRKGRDIL